MSSLDRFRSKRSKVETEIVWQNGKPIACELLNPAKRKNKFARVDLEWLSKAAKASGCPCAAVLVALRYLSWKHKGEPFALTNTIFRQMNIDRRVKYRVLKDLEVAGLVQIECRGSGRAPVVNLSGC